MAGFTRKEDSELVVQRKKEKAIRVLGFPPYHRPHTKEEVLERYRSLVRALHPDSAMEVAEMPPASSFDKLRQAKDYLVKQLENKNG